MWPAGGKTCEELFIRNCVLGNFSVTTNQLSTKHSNSNGIQI